MLFSLDKLFSVHTQVLAARSYRAEVLANNLSNVDTPNYKARDLDFRVAMDQAQQAFAVELAKSHQNHLVNTSAPEMRSSLRYRVPLQPSLDGNTVDAQMEKANFTENAVRYQASLHFLSSEIAGLIQTLREK